MAALPGLQKSQAIASAVSAGERARAGGGFVEHNPTFGFRTLKGHGARLVRNITTSPNGGNDTDDWHNFMVKEGTSGHHLYRMIVTRQKGLEVIGIVYGRTSRKAWLNAYAMLHEKGVMPTEAYEAMLESKGIIDGE